MNVLEKTISEILQDLRSIVEDDYIKQEYECEIKAAIKLIQELEDIRQLQMISIRASHEVIHKIRKTIEEY